MNTNTKTRTDIHRIDGKIIMSVYGPSLFVAVDISKGETMDNIERINELVDEITADHTTDNPLMALQVAATLELARQTQRIADVLEKANSSTVHQVGSNLPDLAREWPGSTFSLGVDPMEPDYKALAADEPTSQIQDSRDSAGL